MSGLWLPVDRLSRAPLAEVSPGRLVVLPPAGNEQRSLPMAIRLQTQGVVAAYALTPFHDGASPAGDVINLSHEGGTALVLDGVLSIEADVGAAGDRGTIRDPLPGELIDTEQGVALCAYINRHEHAFRSKVGVSVNSWEVLASDSSRVIFGRWRLRIDIDERRPIFWSPPSLGGAS